MEICKECGEEKENRKGLSYHCSTKHGMKFADYIVKHELSGVWPTCSCGCGKQVNFFGGQFVKAVGGHGQKGKPKSEITKQRISETQKGKKLSDEHRENIKQTMRQNFIDGNGTVHLMNDAVRGTNQTIEHRQRLSKIRLAKFASGELTINRDAISLSMTQKYIDGDFGWVRGHHMSSKLRERDNAYYRSSWELRHMVEMDENVDIASYLYEPFSISYEWEKMTRRYIPDFLVTFADGRRELQEVGVGKLKSRTSRNLAKQAAASVLCEEKGWTFKVISF